MGRRIDITGNAYGRLTVLEMDHINKHHDSMWLCKCICGNTIVASSNNLRRGNTQSCGCYQSEQASKSNLKNLLGSKYGKLTVVELINAKSVNDRYRRWLCKCDCGNTKVVTSHSLLNGKTLDCGCIFKNKLSSNATTVGINKAYGMYLRGAKNRNIKFELSIELFKEIVMKNCFYCGEEPNRKAKNYGKEVLINGIDRRNNDIGYIEGNIVPCCKTCNFMKHNLGEKEWLDKVSKIYEFQRKIQYD